MKLYLVRHGETVQNRANVIQGQQPGELSPLGLQQRERLAERLRTLHFDAIYSSDLKRTRDTLVPYLTAVGEPVVTYSELIRERAFGDLEGFPGEKYVELLHQAGMSRVEYRPPNGENFHDLKARTDSFVKSIQEQHRGESILLMTHGGTIRTLLAFLLNRSVEDLLAMEIRNTSISTVFLDSEFSLQEHTLNDHAHLEGLEAPGAHSGGVDIMKGTPT